MGVKLPIRVLLGRTQLALRDIAWIGYSTEGYVFVGLVYFSCCFAMSLYSRRLERRHHRGQ